MAENAESVWLLGRRSDWEGTVSHGTYRLCNVSGNPTASFANRFSYLEKAGNPVNQSEAKVSLRVKLEPPLGQHSGAGLLYRKNAENPDHYVFILSGGGTVSIGHVSKSLKFLWSDRVTADVADFVKLSIEGVGERIDFQVNDELVHTLHDAEIVSGDPGVFALSTGCFVFDDVAVYLPSN